MKRLRSAGLSEERIQSLVSDLLREGRVSLAPHELGVDIFILSKGDQVQRTEEEIRLRLGDAIYGQDEETLEMVVGYLLSLQGLSLGVAESCTGGLIMDRLTDVPGSSQYFKGGVVAYSKEVKIGLLGVPEELIKEKGDVNEEVAGYLAEGIVRLFKTGIGLGLVGNAGPGGASKEHPIGEVFIALHKDGKTNTWCLQFKGGRRQIKVGATQAALDILRRALLK